MKLENIKVGMKVKVVKIIEDADDPANTQHIGKTGLVTQIQNTLIKVNSCGNMKFYAEELQPLERKKIKPEDMIL